MSKRYLDIDDLVVDKEFEKLLPILTPDEFNNLEKSILKNGLLDPIKVWQDPETNKWLIIDGHNRYKILKKNNITWNSWCDYKIMYETDLSTREDVKQWMLEQQLGRRNLSETERYKIVQKFKSVFEKKAKDNQSSGGKGLSNLSKVNTRKEMAKAVGVSEGTYQKIDKIMKSDNEDLKQKLEKKEISVDKAYKKIKSTDQNKPITPEEQIDKLDKRINEIDETIESLQSERTSIIKKRSDIFYALDIKSPLRYRWIKKDYSDLYPCLWDCQIYIENNGREEILGDYSVHSSEYPNIFIKNRKWIKGFDREDIPEKYRNDFRMVWKQAHDEVVRLQQEADKKIIESAREQDELMKKIMNLIPNEEDKVVLKKFYHVLANIYHPDNEKTGDADMMQYVNNLKEIWGV
ncbi:ParB/RepB/Spo0J family partition protein [[Clostridium] scindens]|uniref:ParB/RepB/Spo0J family partition protein n=1 Tax=Clostridium scindens (strain JCM 10418 / VPI 12708) TaxID=29347 RepID=UPI00248DDFAA|nr:ParB N-terminal domain-containing protein [[Clostridium] scindens]